MNKKVMVKSCEALHSIENIGMKLKVCYINKVAVLFRFSCVGLKFYIEGKIYKTVLVLFER
jgi:hypothetical protein